MKFDTEVLKRLREAKGYNISEVAKGLGMHRQQYHQIEKGANTPSLETIGKIAAFYKVPGTLFIK
jgi:transcriptional regulator with XRE-family HTH domain